MGNDEKKEYLKGYERAVRQMNRIELRIKEMRLNKICPSIISDGMPHVSRKDDLSGYAAMLEQEEQQYINARYQRILLCKDIMDKIENLSSEDEKDVLTSRYIKLMKWEDICVNMGYSWMWIHKLHGKALEHFTIS